MGKKFGRAMMGIAYKPGWECPNPDCAEKGKDAWVRHQGRRYCRRCGACRGGRK